MFYNSYYICRAFARKYVRQWEDFVIAETSDTKVKDYIRKYLNPSKVHFLIHLEMTSGK